METSLQDALESDNTEALDAVLLAALQDKGQRWRQEGISRTRRLELLVEVWERAAGRTASLVASVLALLVRNGSADVNTSATTAYDVSLARRLLYEHGGRMQRMLGSGHDGEVAGALRILAAVAEIGGGFAREALTVLYGVQRVLLELLRSQRHRRERKRRLDGIRRTSMTEHALVHLMANTVRASGSVVEGVREYDILFAELLVNVMRCEAPNEALRLAEALSVCPRLASPRNLSVSLANTLGSGERWQELLAQAIAHSKDSAGVGGILATLRMEVAGRFAVTRQALRLAPQSLLRAYLEQLADRLPRPDLPERECTVQMHAALATEAWMHITEDADAILLPTLPLNPFTCNMYLAALGRCPHRPPPLSLSAVIEYVRVEAARASATLGSLRLARALRLLRYCLKRDPAQAFAARLDLSKAIPRVPPDAPLGCPFTARELVRMLRVGRRQNRALKLGMRMLDLLRLRPVLRAELCAFLADYLAEHGLLWNAHRGALYAVEAALWLDLVLAAAPTEQEAWVQVVTQAVSKPYLLVDEARQAAVDSSANGDGEVVQSPLYAAVRRQAAHTHSAFFSYCLSRIAQTVMVAVASAVSPAEAPVLTSRPELAPVMPADAVTTTPPDTTLMAELERLAPQPVLDVREWVQSGALGTAILGLSIVDERARLRAYDILATVHAVLSQAREFRERRQLMALLDLLRNSITTPRQRIPRAVAVLFQRLAPVVIQPTHHLFRLANSLVMIRPSWPIERRLPFAAELRQRPERRAFEWLLAVMHEGHDGSREYGALLRRHHLDAWVLTASVCHAGLVGRYAPALRELRRRWRQSSEVARELDRRVSFAAWEQIVAL